MSNQPFRLLPEVEEGNIEYKRQLNNASVIRNRKLTSQMLWRMDEGKRNNGIPDAIYYIGIDDDGKISGLSIKELNDSLNNFYKLVKSCDAEVVDKSISYEKDMGYYSKIVIRKNFNINIINDIKVALIGDIGSGKSTLLSVLCYDNFDNGMGSARNSIFRYNHEFKNGITSSIAYEIIGYEGEKVINYNSDFIGNWESIINNSDKLINFIDLPGSDKFFKTTIFGIMAHLPEYIIFTIDSTKLVSKKINKYINLCKNIGIPYFFIVTKIDLVNENMIKNNLEKQFNMEFTIANEHNFTIDKNNLTLPISNINGKNHNILHKILRNIHKKTNHIIETNGVEFMINQVFYISDIGIVVMGILFSGSITNGDKLLIGPYNNSFCNVTIESIHKKQIPSKSLNIGETGCLFIKFNENNLIVNKHMMIITSNHIHKLTNKFYVQINNENYNKIVHNTNTVVYTLNVSEQIIINKIVDKDDFKIMHIVFNNNTLRYIKNNQDILLFNNNNYIFGKCFRY
jgi:small GTP-binding protein